MHHHRAGQRQQHHPHCHGRLKCRNIHRKACRGNADKLSNAIGNDCRRKARDIRRIEHNAHVDDRHGKKGCGKRGAEQSGKERRHAALHGHAALVLIQVQHAAGPPADGAAHLQSSALAPGTAAAQVGEHRADKHDRQQPEPDGLAILDAVDHIIGRNALQLCRFIKCHNHKADDRQQKQDGGVFGPQFGYMLHSQIKRRTNDTAGHAGNHGQCQPFQQLFCAEPYAARAGYDPFPDVFHPIGSPFYFAIIPLLHRLQLRLQCGAGIQRIEYLNDLFFAQPRRQAKRAQEAAPPLAGVGAAA